MDSLSRRKILITAGPTREPMDPVRYLTNASSGQMGLDLAGVLKGRGAQPTVVLGPVPLKMRQNFQVVPVTTAVQMRRAVFHRIREADVFISTAAVCDFRFKKISRQKIKKNRDEIKIEMVKNPDILKEVGRWKKRNHLTAPILIGFALETGELRRAMKKKLKEKNLDLIIGNTPDSFGNRFITPVWLERNGTFQVLPRMPKIRLAIKIAQWITKI